LKNLFRLVVIFCSISIVTSCATRWVRPYGVSEHQFRYDQDQCKALANNAAPKQQIQQQSYPSTTYHSGTVYDSYGNSSSYSGTSYNNGNPYENLGTGLSNLAASLEQARIIESCLFSKGYKKQSEVKNKGGSGEPQGSSSERIQAAIRQRKALEQEKSGN
jgi:hypothetical protein